MKIRALVVLLVSFFCVPPLHARRAALREGLHLCGTAEDRIPGKNRAKSDLAYAKQSRNSRENNSHPEVHPYENAPLCR